MPATGGFTVPFARRIQAATHAVEQLATRAGFRSVRRNSKPSGRQQRMAIVLATGDSSAGDSSGGDCGVVRVYRVQLLSASFREVEGIQSLTLKRWADRADLSPGAGSIKYAAAHTSLPVTSGDIVSVWLHNDRYWIDDVVGALCDTSGSDSGSDSGSGSDSFSDSGSTGGSSGPDSSGNGSDSGSNPGSSGNGSDSGDSGGDSDSGSGGGSGSGSSIDTECCDGVPDTLTFDVEVTSLEVSGVAFSAVPGTLSLPLRYGGFFPGGAPGGNDGHFWLNTASTVNFGGGGPPSSIQMIHQPAGAGWDGHAIVWCQVLPAGGGWDWSYNHGFRMACAELSDMAPGPDAIIESGLLGFDTKSCSPLLLEKTSSSSNGSICGAIAYDACFNGETKVRGVDFNCPGTLDADFDISVY